VDRKSDIKTWRTAVATGELFTVDLADADGTQILGSFLDKQVTKFYPLIEEEKEYYVTKGKIKLVNKRVTSIPNNFCINFCDDTEFTPVADYEESC
jgi:replication factor A1